VPPSDATKIEIEPHAGNYVELIASITRVNERARACVCAKTF
jgi:hypothetical protein